MVARRRVVVGRVVTRVVALPARRGPEVEEADVQEVAVGVVLIDRARLVVDVVQEALEAVVTGRGLAAGRPAGCGLVVAGPRRALIRFDVPARAVQVEQELV